MSRHLFLNLSRMVSLTYLWLHLYTEEGLDIPEVDLVVFYEPIPSEIRYIQRKGRTGRKSAGMVTILGANDTVDIRHLFASNQRAEKMKKSLNMINTVLKPINRAFLGPNLMTSEELSILENRRRRLDERLDKTVESELDKGRLLDTEIANRINQLRESKKQTSLLFEAELVTGNFMRQVYRPQGVFILSWQRLEDVGLMLTYSVTILLLNILC